MGRHGNYPTYTVRICMDIDDIFYGYYTFYTTSMVITSIQHYMGKIFNPNWLYFCMGSKSTVRGVVWVHDIFLPSCSVVSWRVTPLEPVGEDSSKTRHGEHRLRLAKKS